MTKSLVIVESPAKAKTIKKYLGSGYTVKASVGHIKDLPPSKLGVDIEAGFEPTYQVIKGKAKIVKEIVDAAMKSDAVYLAPDPDREGEAIAWHISEEIKSVCKPKKAVKKGAKKDSKKTKEKDSEASSGPIIKRILFNEITSKAIKEAIKKPLELDQNLFDAQQARRILDRLVGYQISPILWDKVRRGLSAGRVQSVAVRIICEREELIKAFIPQEYWSIVAKLEGSKPPPFEAKLIEVGGKKAEIGTGEAADSILKKLKKGPFILTKIAKQERRRHPVPPFITSKIQQEAARKLGFTAKKTMTLAQQLYEGIDIGGDEGTVGLITYMRTDSIRVSDDAITEVRELIKERFGADYLPGTPNVYKSRKGAQDAHEAIRPTSMVHTPESLKEFLDKDQLKLYDLIWKRFIASQMTSAIFDATSFDIKCADCLMRATGQVMKFAGFIAVYIEGQDEVDEKDEEENPTLPDLKEGEELKNLGLEPHQHFTQPPPRFTEASLVKELEEKGIGRPSTYASIMSTIQEKEYVEKREGRFFPTRLGDIVNGLLVGSFPDILDVQFTAQMEQELDDVEDGKRGWTDILKDFYGPFGKALERAKEHMKDVKRQEIETDVKCEKCGSAMVIKWGRRGEFLACSKYPDCKSTKEFRHGEDGEIVIVKEETTNEVCPKCGAPMAVKRGRFGTFLACSKYPDCKTTKSITTGVKCPECNEGDLVQRQSKRGKAFYSCERYPKCKFAMWDKPVGEKCPLCGNPYLVEKYTKKDGAVVKCPAKDCGYKK